MLNQFPNISLLQCKSNLVPHEKPRGVVCCNNTDFCNRDLIPLLYSRTSPPDTGKLTFTFLFDFHPLHCALTLTPWNTELRNLNFHPLKVVSRYRDPQLQVAENLCYLRNLSPNIYQCFKIRRIFNFYQLVIQVLIKTQNVYCSRHQCSNT